MPIAKIQLPDGRIAELQVPEGTTQNQIKEFVLNNQNQFASQPQESSKLEKTSQFLQGIPQGLGNKFVGAVQSATTLVAPESEFAQNLTKEITRLKEKQSQLPAAEQYGIKGGEITGDVMLASNPLLKGSSLATQGLIAGGISALTNPLEDSSKRARGEEVATNSALGLAFGGALQLGGKAVSSGKEGLKNIVKGWKARTPEELAVITQELGNKSRATYEAMREAGATIRPQAANQILANVNKSLVKDGKINSRLHGDTLSVLDDFTKEVKSGKLDLEGLDQYRQLLGKVVSKNTDIAGNLNPDALKATTAINKIDDIVESFRPSYLINSGNKQAVDLLNKARSEWATKMKFQKVANIIQRADGDPNRIKAGIKRFIDNQKNLKGFTAQERQALKLASRNTTGEGILKQAGKFGFDIGSGQNIGNAALPGGIAIFGGRTGATTAAVGTAARQAQKFLARGKADDALRIIQQNPIQIIANISERKGREAALRLLVNSLASGSSNISNQAQAQENQNQQGLSLEQKLIQQGFSPEVAREQSQKTQQRFNR